MSTNVSDSKPVEMRLEKSVPATPDRLLKALDTEAIWPAFQPLVAFQNSRIFGFEVLARWTDPVLGEISPNEFIPLAEANGLIATLTKKLVSKACREAMEWPGDFILAINISPTQFRDPELFDLIASSVSHTGFPLSRIHIEITEGALLQDDVAARSTIAAIKNAGMGLALDDFGTGYASLTQLHAFPFDKLKIDMSFVRSMENDIGSRKIVASVVGLGQSLGMTVVAEGVETEEQAAMLRRLGCDLGQGWLFGRPLNADQSRLLLRSRQQSALPPRGSSASLFHRIHQLDALYKAAPIGLSFLDVDLIHVSVNDRFASMFGKSPDTIIGRTVHQFMSKKEATRVTGLLRKVLNGETVIVDDYRPIGSKNAFLIINQRVDDDAGVPIGISVTAIDVTDRKKIEAALAETEDHARWSIDLIPSIPWASDPKGTLTFIGPTPNSSAESTIARIDDWLERMHPGDRVRVKEEWLNWLPSGKPFETLFRMKIQDGDWRWMISRAKPHFNVKGKITKWYGVVTDVGERGKLGERAALEFGSPPSARESEFASQDVLPAEHLISMLVRMFEFAPIAMSITTSDEQTSKYVKVNDAYLRLTGRKWAEIKGKRLTAEGAVMDNPARERRHRLLKEVGSYEMEDVDIIHADGTVIPTLISAQRTLIDGVSFDVEVIMDVSSRVRQQRELESALKTSARTDSLSGLPNRAAFDEFLEDAVARNLLNNRKLALAYIDLNGFKLVNDTHGHAAGDEVLRMIAARLRENFRASDFIARIGGDEFAVVMDLDQKFAGGLQAELLEKMERVFKPIPIAGQVTITGGAVGVTVLQAGDTPQSYVKRADEYMYLAKATRERVAVFYFGQLQGTAQRPSASVASPPG